MILLRLDVAIILNLPGFLSFVRNFHAYLLNFFWFFCKKVQNFLSEIYVICFSLCYWLR